MKKITYIIIASVVLLLLIVLLVFVLQIQNDRSGSDLVSTQEETQEEPIRVETETGSDLPAQGQTEQEMPPEPTLELVQSVNVKTMELLIPEGWTAQQKNDGDLIEVMVYTPMDMEPFPLTMEIVIQGKDGIPVEPDIPEHYEFESVEIGPYQAATFYGSVEYLEEGQLPTVLQERIFLFEEQGSLYKVQVRYLNEDQSEEIEAMVEEILSNSIF